MQRAAEKSNVNPTKRSRDSSLNYQAQVPTLQCWSDTAGTCPSTPTGSASIRQDTQSGSGSFSMQAMNIPRQSLLAHLSKKKNLLHQLPGVWFLQLKRWLYVTIHILPASYMGTCDLILILTIDSAVQEESWEQVKLFGWGIDQRDCSDVQNDKESQSLYWLSSCLLELSVNDLKGNNIEKYRK